MSYVSIKIVWLCSNFVCIEISFHFINKSFCSKHLAVSHILLSTVDQAAIIQVACTMS